ncbi:MAG: DUF5107 domain-containing protein, partial [Blautia sp.]|nr:DUF5107 domain-containing protein [Blautia sp.]
RVFLELDQLYKKLQVPAKERLAGFEKYAIGADGREALIEKRDDLMIEYVTLLNTCGRYRDALDAILGHVFRPWEGAEGKVSAQYKVALTQLAKEKLKDSDYAAAKELLEKALALPLNLGEGRLEGTKDNHIWYLLGTALEAMEGLDGAKGCYERATEGTDEPAGMMYYYDQPADMILYKGRAFDKLGEHRRACACFHKLVDYGERHLRDQMRMDYFAVSLPDFSIWEDDLTGRNEAHCYYLMGLGHLGLLEKEEARRYLLETLQRDPSHQNAILYLQETFRARAR